MAAKTAKLDFSHLNILLNSRIIMAPIPPPASRYIQVHKSERISAHLQRIYFSSDNFSDFPAENGAHIKLFFPETGQIKPNLPRRNAQGKVVWPDGKKPITRTYTIRDFLVEEQLLIVDFVRHEDFGIAAHWATQAQPGDYLGLAGPGGQARFQSTADYWLFAVDLSALAMLAASLELLPHHAQGEVWIEITDVEDQIQLQHPAGIKINWLLPSADVETCIEQAAAQLNWQSQCISVTLAGENARVVALRCLFMQRYQLRKSALYAVPYWKKGQDEEAYHQERHRVMDEII